MEADFNSIFFRSSSFFCQLPFTFTLTAACVGDSFFSAFIHTVLRLKRKCLYSIKSEQKVNNAWKMQVEVNSIKRKQFRTIPLIYCTIFSALRSVNNKFLSFFCRRDWGKLVDFFFFKHCSEIWFHPLRDCFVHTRFRMSFFRVDNNFPLFRLRKHEKSKSKQCFAIDERSWKKSN